MGILGGIGKPIVYVANSAADSYLLDKAYNSGLAGDRRPKPTSDAALNYKTDQAYEDGRDERKLQVEAISRVVSVNLSDENIHVRRLRDD